MTPEIDHIYECTWAPRATISFINLVTCISDDRVSGRCLSDGSAFGNSMSTWKKSTSTITLIGHKDDFPELFI